MMPDRLRATRILLGYHVVRHAFATAHMAHSNNRFTQRFPPRDRSCKLLP